MEHRSENLKAETRRGIFSFIASVYDLLGLVAPVVLPAKRMLQEFCRKNHEWDETPPSKTNKKWQSLQNEFQLLTTTEVPRSCKPPGFKEVELHHFTDASIDGYETVSYLRLGDSSRKVHCSLVMGKSRVAPLETVTSRLARNSTCLLIVLSSKLTQSSCFAISEVRQRDFTPSSRIDCKQFMTLHLLNSGVT